MNQPHDWIEENIPYRLRKKGLQIFDDENLFYEDKLIELYRLGQTSRDVEIQQLVLEKSVLNRHFKRTNINVDLRWLAISLVICAAMIVCAIIYA